VARCRGCGQPFALAPGRTIFCGVACYHAWQRERASTGILARFWAKVKRDREDACWLWTAGTIKGYGQFNIGRDANGKCRIVYAHRFAWEVTNGPIAANDLFVLHRCDVPLCCNPQHLFLGTQADNLEDARRKGRLIDGRHLIKLSEAARLDIRANYRPRQNGRELAAKYGVTLVHLLRVVRGTDRVRRPVVFERIPHVGLPVVGEVS